jgi:DNA-binding NarL/FixJ family response regulator
MATRIAIVEDDQGICEELSLLIGEVPDFACACVCRNARTALRLVPKSEPDVILMDIQLPDGSGIECTEELKRKLPAAQIMILTVYEDSSKIYKALAAGASGYLLKRTPPDELVRAIRELRSGGVPMSSEVARKVIRAFRSREESADRVSGLTPREEEVLELLARGQLSKEIAGELGISVETVNSHLKHIYEKLHVRTRVEAVLKYRR